MPLSPYDFVMRRNGLKESNSVADADADADSSAEVELFLESASAFSLDDSMSLTSSPVGFRELPNIILSPDIVDGMENTRNISNDDLYSYGERTIVSSNPSEASITPPPEAFPSFFAISPHPRIAVNGVHSISTTNTEIYTNDGLFQTDEDEESASTASTSTSFNHTSISSASNGDRSVSGLYEVGVSERIDSNVVKASSSDSHAEDLPIRFVSKSSAKNILSILSEDSSSPTRPPIISPVGILASTKELQESGFCAKDYLPSDFICGICSDVIVGGCILDCNCISSVVCTTCWENNLRSKSCPSCKLNAEVKAYCRTLDVAIIHIIENLPDSNDNVSSLKQGYYFRLSEWRIALSDRNERHETETVLSENESLAEHIKRKPGKMSNLMSRFSKAAKILIAVVLGPLIAAALRRKRIK
mmetsp:Transcript_21435/g.45482  ORF Transcript_21435/g.45482 Transcript_21435/m.45482 type:complete len:418 (+) Transcript_21435:66-1319(+)|eukprot:CAMPEP_0168261038 /NCGR_PEP_ID=MMETSP0141_2-20121125/8788_1 /TAXON_ID=44445 /ORGANISM="Pseudo-nitzschia australis, Strain 10249 10 AB" /LENGTH=417 /DNA_ID=CAMNT_0008199005 /DNA_START=54 /DNA_END=1307 /DNA_ORIENTATION=-